MSQPGGWAMRGSCTLIRVVPLHPFLGCMTGTYTFLYLESGGRLVLQTVPVPSVLASGPAGPKLFTLHPTCPTHPASEVLGAVWPLGRTRYHLP